LSGCRGEACLHERARGNDLEAENAQYMLGLLARERGSVSVALEAWHTYRMRFPDGALAPEARVAEMNDLARSGDVAQAAELAREFLRRYPNEPASAQLRAWVVEKN
jgi:TolA-binding protein